MLSSRSKVGSSSIVRYSFRCAISVVTKNIKTKNTFYSQQLQQQQRRFFQSSTIMSTNFASTKYASAFHDLPVPDRDSLKQSTVDYLENKFNPKLWYDEPISSILKGEKLTTDVPSNLITTKDALGQDNGQQYNATKEQVDMLKDHIRTYKSPYTDLRAECRRIEEKLLSSATDGSGYAGFLIGNQCVDFGKQDGITEIEESIMANVVERRLNDMLIDDDLKSGRVTISRKPIYISCVSNFTNFLDLFRKTIRSLELGVPCVVLGRSNTAQHCYRWTELLSNLLKEENVDAGMITFLSCSLDDIKDITQSCQDYTGNLYTTCSRALAQDIKSSYDNTVSSTGGPNTLVAAEWTDKIQDAIKMSAAIECAGQCTALRHAVVPDTVKQDDVQSLFNNVEVVPDAPSALKESKFDCVFAKHAGSQTPPTDEFMTNEKADAYYKISHDLPGDDIEEYWRKVTVDFTQMATTANNEEKKNIVSLASWLNRNQPISLAVNAHRQKSFDLGMSLFEKTGLVVYTVGSTNNENMPPALTCQARPQEAEVFGEFPPRKSLGMYTRYPVVVPSSTPSYDATYTKKYLESLSLPNGSDGISGVVQDIVKEVSNKEVQGYCIELLQYLSDATKESPKRGFGTSRTALWGLQRPPILDGLKTYIRCGTNLDDVAPMYLLFFATNARDQVVLSVDKNNKDLLSIVEKYNLTHTVETDNEFNARETDCYNIVRVDGPMKNYPMVGQFVSLYFPLGHIKSTMSEDDEFVSVFKESPKWLKMHT